jgi:hypothetical protein
MLAFRFVVAVERVQQLAGDRLGDAFEWAGGETGFCNTPMH